LDESQARSPDEIVGALGSVPDGYLNTPIPSAFDRKLAEIVAWIFDEDSPQKQGLARLLGAQNRNLMHAFCERMSSLGVRSRSSGDVRCALVALMLGWTSDDYRDSLVVLALPYHAAFTVGMDPAALFDELASFAPPGVAAHLRAFPRRGAQASSLKAMGWSEGSDAEGFRYVRIE
jgi:hypothetical protein